MSLLASSQVLLKKKTFFKFLNRFDVLFVELRYILINHRSQTLFWTIKRTYLTISFCSQSFS